MSNDLRLFSYEILGLVGSTGVATHDLRRMVERGRMLDWAGEKAVRLGRTFVRLDCVSDNYFLRDYYTLSGFDEHGEVEATFPAPVGTLRLQRYEKRVGTD